MTRYQLLAQEIRRQIEDQTWRAGDKIPSVRATSRSHQVSTSTVLQAFQLLESEGLLVARPQSGYFVAAKERTASVSEVPKPALINDQLFTFLKQSADETLIPLGSAFPDPTLFPARDLARNLASANRQVSSTSWLSHLPPGDETLRRKIAQRYLQQGIHISHHDIVVTSGALEALNLSLEAVTVPGDYVIIESPAFYGALQAIERLNLKPVEVPVDTQHGLDFDVLEVALATYPVRACWLMPTFHNPTGSCLTESARQRLMQRLAQQDVAVIEDDVYGELYFGERKPKPLKAFDHNGQVLLCGSLSKSLSPGYRVGWVVSERYNELIQRQQLLSTISSSVPVQKGLAHYLTHESYDNHLRKLRRALAERQLAMSVLMRECLPPEVTVAAPEGGYFLWLRLPHEIDTNVVHQVALEHGISVAPGSLFAFDDRFVHCLRINSSYSLDDPRIAAAIQALGHIITRLSNCSVR